MAAAPRVLIAGAGLGGVTAALALAQGGQSVLVLEQVPDLKAVQLGIGMVLWPNGMSALKRLGLFDQVAAVGSQIDTLDFQTPDGSTLRRWSVGRLGEGVGAPTVGLSRADLHRVLANALPEGTVRLGSKCVDVKEDDSGVTVRLADGDEIAGRVLIGADGGFSGLRQQYFGLGRPEFPPYSGYTLWHSIIPFDEQAVPSGVFFLIFGRGTRFSYFRIDDERVYWSAIAYVDQGGKESTSDYVQELFSHYVEPTPGLIRATADADVHRTDIFGGEGMPTWGRGRMTLLGDAAHPMTTNLGQGAGMAIEDGVVLGHEFANASSDEEALRRYETRRMERVTRMMELANKLNSDAALETPFRSWLRNQLLKHLFYRGLGSKWEAMLTEELLPGTGPPARA